MEQRLWRGKSQVDHQSLDQLSHPISGQIPLKQQEMI